MKRHLALLLCPAAVAIACDDNSPPLFPPSAVPPIPLVREIELGEDVEAMMSSFAPHHFLLKAPRDGKLFVEPTWNVDRGTPLELQIDGQKIASACCSSPITETTGSVDVSAGDRVEIVVSVGAVEMNPEDPFTLTTRLE